MLPGKARWLHKALGYSFTLGLLALTLPAWAEPAEAGRLVRDLLEGQDDGSLPLYSAIAGLGEEVFFAGVQSGIVGLWRTGREGGPPELVTTVSVTPRQLTPTGSRLWFRDRQEEFLVTDGTPGGTLSAAAHLPLDQQPTFPSDLVKVGESRWLFLAQSLATGREPWVTDGTSKGTRVLDLNPGPADSISFRTASIGNLGTAAMFFASTPQGAGLWRSDGTQTGTVRFTSIPDAFDSFLGTVHGGRSLLLMRRPNGASRFWSTDGTDDGTFPLNFPGGFEGRFFLITESVSEEGWLLFIEPLGDGERLPCEIWRTDGTASGSRKVIDFGTLAASQEGLQTTCPRSVVAAGGRHYFSLSEGFSRAHIWSTDGTFSGTAQLPELVPGEQWNRIEHLTAFGSGFAFSAAPFGTGGIFVSDGTALGTRRISERGHAQMLAAVGDQLWYSFGAELWESDGSVGGEREVTNFPPEEDSSSPRKLVRLGHRALFLASTSRHASQLFSTDGSREGTFPLSSEILPNGTLGELKVFGEKAFFVTNGSIFESDGTAEGSHQAFAPPGHIQDFSRVGSRFVFRGQGEEGFEPWVSDGTPEGTHLLLDLFPGTHREGEELPEVVPNSSWPDLFIHWNGRVYFVAENDRFERALWVTDGTALGTRALARIASFSTTPQSGRDTFFVATEERLFFFNFETALWVSDGEPAGTHQIRDGAGELVGGFCEAEFRQRCIFARISDSQPRTSELWWTDGSAEGTRLITTLPEGTFLRGSSNRSPAVKSTGQQLFFSATSQESGNELWVTDGTRASTRQVIDLIPGTAGSEPGNFRTLSGRLLFSATDPVHGRELWVSDGTADGTRLLAEVRPGPASSDPEDFLPLGDQILFGAERGDVGRELFAIDRDLIRGSCVPSPSVLCLANGRFAVDVDWHSHRTGRFGRANAVEYSRESGQFWFFDDENIELLVKILDGRNGNGHHWYFSGAVTNVEYWVTVTDHQTGRTRTYHNPAGTLCGHSDLQTFGEEDAVASMSGLEFAASAPSSVQPTTGSTEDGETCAPGPEDLLLHDGRFAVEASWSTDRRGGRSGAGHAVLATEKSASFWFFKPENLELVVKILDGRANNGKFWVLYGALSDVAYTLRVTDLTTCETRVYTQAERNLCGGVDLSAF